MALHGEPVLGLAGDPPVARRGRHVLAHRQPGARLHGPRRHRHQVGRPQPGDHARPVDVAAGPPHLDEGLLQPLAHGKRGVTGGVGAGRDGAVDLAQGDLVGHEDRCLQAGGAGLLDVERRRRRGERRAEHRLAGEVVVVAVLEHRAAHDLTDLLPREPETVDQALQGSGEHVLVAHPRIRTVGSRERNPVAPEDRHPTAVLPGHCLAPSPGRSRTGSRVCRAAGIPQGEPSRERTPEAIPAGGQGTTTARTPGLSYVHASSTRDRGKVHTRTLTCPLAMRSMYSGSSARISASGLEPAPDPRSVMALLRSSAAGTAAVAPALCPISTYAVRAGSSCRRCGRARRRRPQSAHPTGSRGRASAGRCASAVNACASASALPLRVTVASGPG